MNKWEKVSSESKIFHDTTTGTKVALWWLRHYEGVTGFWRGFSWVWVIFVLFYVIEGYIDIGHALWIIFSIGVVANAGIYLGIRTMSSYLRNLEDSPEKEEAHELMIKIIKRRAMHSI